MTLYSAFAVKSFSSVYLGCKNFFQTKISQVLLNFPNGPNFRYQNKFDHLPGNYIYLNTICRT